MQGLELFDRYGFAALVSGTFLIGGGWAAWRIVSYVGMRLFAEKTGLFTRVTDRHIDFIDHTEAIAERTAATMEELSNESKRTNAVLEEMLALHRDPDSVFSTARTNRALLYIADIIELCHAIHGDSENARAIELKLQRLREVLQTNGEIDQ